MEQAENEAISNIFYMRQLQREVRLSGLTARWPMSMMKARLSHYATERR